VLVNIYLELIILNHHPHHLNEWIILLGTSIELVDIGVELERMEEYRDYIL
jgi:hypothetical protein